MRRVTVRTPGARQTRHYRLRKPSPARCQMTGEKLQAVASKRPDEMAKLSKTEKRPQRPYGGVLSSRAARSVNIAEARMRNNA